MDRLRIDEFLNRLEIVLKDPFHCELTGLYHQEAYDKILEWIEQLRKDLDD